MNGYQSVRHEEERERMKEHHPKEYITLVNREGKRGRASWIQDIRKKLQLLGNIVKVRIALVEHLIKGGEMGVDKGQSCCARFPSFVIRARCESYLNSGPAFVAL